MTIAHDVLVLLEECEHAFECGFRNDAARLLLQAEDKLSLLVIDQGVEPDEVERVSNAVSRVRRRIW
ncbi:hypothetical protein COT72_02345 [archaeon CG10_big_fil_rev_8_21_14_0_10_43_11]|nr:MAG: hypothetical protein COT72_02345 [archaeon CG10_big_fil_rev_8_21_14_0_10_43_11]